MNNIDEYYAAALAQFIALKGRVLRVTFRRRNAKTGPKGVVIQPAMSIRTMKCQFTGDNTTADADRTHRCVTVWCLEEGEEGHKRIPLDPEHFIAVQEWEDRKLGNGPSNRGRRAKQ
jgi:hypothetical protein